MIGLEVDFKDLDPPRPSTSKITTKPTDFQFSPTFADDVKKKGQGVHNGGLDQQWDFSPLHNHEPIRKGVSSPETQTWRVLTPCRFGKAETLVQGEKMLERLRANTQDSPWSQQRMSLTVKGNKKQNKYFDSVIIFFFRTRSICCFKSLILIVNVVLCTLGMDPKNSHGNRLLISWIALWNSIFGH